MSARGWLRWVVLGLALLTWGCGVAERRAERYRVEQVAYQAQRAERELRLSRTRPDSTQLLALRKEYARVRQVAKPPYLGRGSEASRAVGREVLQAVMAGELQSARLAMEAGRPDIALEQSRWIEQNSEGDSLVQRQADFLAVGALRMMGRADDAVERMRAMLRRYEPVPPPAGTTQEDALLAVPEMMALIRTEQGDRAGAARELEYGVGYYLGLLERPRVPTLEALIRARLIRLQLERNQAPAALEQVAALERLVAANPPLKGLEPELAYSRAKIRAMTEKDRTIAVPMLERFAAQYPKHPLAARAMFDAAIFLEDAKRYPDALMRYRRLVAAYSENEELAPIALFRQAMLEEKTGDWNAAKATLESLPVKYPRSQAALEAPVTIAERYFARGDKDAARNALGRAIVVYQEMIAKDSSSVMAPVLRYNILRGQLSLGQWDRALTTVDDMALRNPRHPLTAQALLDGARVANSNRQKDRAAGYLQQFLENFPDASIAAQVRRDKERLLQ